MVSYCKFIYILLFSSAMHSLICYSSNPWTPMITAQWSHSADGRRISCWWSASCLSRLHITTNTEQRNFCLSCQSSRSVLHSNLLEFKFCSSLKSNSGNYRQTWCVWFRSWIWHYWLQATSMPVFRDLHRIPVQTSEVKVQGH